MSAGRWPAKEVAPIQASIFALIVHYGLPLVALMIFGGELGLPTGVPMEVALLLVGGYAVPSLPILIGGIVLVTAADVAGTTLLFLAVRSSGWRLLARLLRAHTARGEEAMARWRQRLGGHDVTVVFLGRMLPLVRMYLPFGAALVAMSLRDFLLGAVPGAAVWAGTPLVVGFVFRADVRHIAAAYARFAHVAFFVLAAAALLVAAVWWIRSGASSWARLHRGRAACGLAAVIATVVFLVTAAIENDRAADLGSAALSPLTLAAWAMLLSAVALALLWLALSDLRVARTAPAPTPERRRLQSSEVAGTLAWIGLLVVLGMVMLGLEWRYPAL